jgi:hypothetical protein
MSPVIMDNFSKRVALSVEPFLKGGEAIRELLEFCEPWCSGTVARCSPITARERELPEPTFGPSASAERLN